MATTIKVFTKNENNKIEFTEQELQALLDEIFNKGFYEGKFNSNYTWTSPYVTCQSISGGYNIGESVINLYDNNEGQVELSYKNLTDSTKTPL